MATSRDHKNLKNAIRLALGKRGDVVIWNNESGVAEYQDRPVRYGVGKGGADLLGICNVQGVGRFIALEVKTGKATASAEQKMFLALVRKYGGYATVVRSVEDAIRAVEECRNGRYGDGVS
jgi:hypothetical protein